MAYKDDTVLKLVKARLNRAPGDTLLDEYLTARIEAADAELTNNGITLDEDSAEDAMLLVDTVVWQYLNRDNMAGMPEWLRLRRRERFLSQQRGG